MADENDNNKENQDSPSSLPKCKLGETHCEWLEEIRTLRKKCADLTERLRTDELTGLFNFRHFQEVLPQEMERTMRTGAPTALAVLDIDHFKKINDTWGHENGNRVLVQLSHLMEAAIRKIDIACRFGGEEFVLILPNTSIGQATIVAERLRSMIENTPVDVPQGVIRYTASIGVDIYTRDDTITMEQFMERADTLLYEAKGSGRNKLVAREIETVTAVTKEEKDMLLGLD